MCPNEGLAIDCAVLNVSAGGACILVPEGSRVPGSFMLRVDNEAPMRDCKFAWREGCKIGVSFG